MKLAAVKESRKPGRPRKFAEGRINATVRFTPERYAELKATADKAGRSVSEQVEAMIEELHRTDTVLDAVRTNAAALRRQVFQQDHRPFDCGSVSGLQGWWPKDDPNGPPPSGSFGRMKMGKLVFPQDRRPTRRKK
jgi:hypothetical protein